MPTQPTSPRTPPSGEPTTQPSPPTSSPTSPSPGLNRQILALAVPALGALVTEPLFVLIDSSMVGHLGASALAGLSLASTLLTTAVGLFVFLAYATTATTARLFGAGDRRGGLRAGVDGIWLAGLIGAAACLLLWVLAPWATHVMGARGQVAHGAIAYLRASAPGLPGMLVVYAATGTLRGLLDTRTPFVVATAGAGLNVALNATFLYGARMGVAGSGLGTAITQTLMAVALTWPVVRAARADAVPLTPRRQGLTASLGSGTPLLVRTVSLRVAILVTAWAATTLGQAPLAAHQVVMSVWNFAAFTLDALAIAAQALVGTALGQADAALSQDAAQTGKRDGGRGSEARVARADAAPAGSARADGSEKPRPAGATMSGPAGADAASAGPADADAASAGPALTVDGVLRRCLAWGVATGVVIGVVVAAASPWLPALFGADPAVRAAASSALLVAASAMPLAGAVFLFDGVLMGAGDGRYLAVAGLLTLVPYVPAALAVVAAFAGDAGAPAVSAATAATEAATAAASAGAQASEAVVRGGASTAGTAGLTWLWVAFAWVFMGARALTTGLRARTDAWRY